MSIRVICVFVIFLSGCDVTQESDFVEVISYSGPPITFAMAHQLSGKWVSSVDPILRQATLEFIEPDSSVSQRITLMEVEGALPAFMGYVHRPGTEYAGTWRSGRIEIQQFNLEGEISGTYDFALSQPLGMRTGGVFFVDRSDTTGAGE